VPLADDAEAEIAEDGVEVGFGVLVDVGQADVPPGVLAGPDPFATGPVVTVLGMTLRECSRLMVTSSRCSS
jgi:hypothetical protein